jgi:hypothetical protein
MKRLLLAIILLASAVPTVAQQDAEIDAAEAAALAWLALTDSGQYAESWQEASSFFRAAITSEDWVNALSGPRGAFGGLQSRARSSAQYATTLPGAPDGEYVVFEFSASFENKANAVETVTAMKDLDGAWRVGGYFVR